MCEGMAKSPVRDARIRSIQSLQSCVRTSFDVVSSASTTLGANDTRSVLAPSDYMDIFPARSQSVMLRWLAETGNTTRYMNQSQALGSVYGEFDVIEDSDSEAEQEVEAIQLQLQKGKEHVQNGNSVTAAKFLAAGISKLKHHRSRYLDAERKLFMLDDLLQPLEEQQNWAEAKRIRLEKLSVLSYDMTTQSDRYLQETLGLVEFLLRAHDINEGRIYARKCIKAYRKLGTDGLDGLKQALELMITACQLEQDEPEEEVYKAMLAQLDINLGSDKTAVEASEPVLPAEFDASSTEIPNYSAEEREKAKSFLPRFPSLPSLLSQSAIEEFLQTDQAVTVTDKVRNIFRNTVPPSEAIPFALNDRKTEQDSITTGTTDEITDDYQSIDDSSTVTTSSSCTDTKDKETGSQSQRVDPYLDLQDSLSGCIGLKRDRQPDFNTNAGSSSNQCIKVTTPSIQIEGSPSQEDGNPTETDVRSIYELDASTTAMDNANSDTHHGPSRTSSVHIQRAFSWEDDNRREKDMFSVHIPDKANTTIEEPRSVADIGLDTYFESSTLSTWISAMHNAPSSEPLEPSAQPLPFSRETESPTATRLPLIDTEAGCDRNDTCSRKIIPNPMNCAQLTIFLITEDQVFKDDEKGVTNETDSIQPKARVTTVILGPSCSGKSSLIQ
ncbi:hypothetical protein PFICI_03376 [Pestalotiopsis fici W106-1]|uniref:Uncharacterized protein n=1 Tax=Pestalotiopsis fici (strain W106-1 / CGMCC3.15140) TaxID=1229662 RepID=W3XJF9_PESFW|nr:uncharacterized protein PFICI_03376 [Pestalotiopsis fici W106-1]ETS85351.1 hypothetical protein PFICI_03376 [Pestalotiopsis fici W106-1]